MPKVILLGVTCNIYQWPLAETCKVSLSANYEKNMQSGVLASLHQFSARPANFYLLLFSFIYFFYHYLKLFKSAPNFRFMI